MAWKKIIFIIIFSEPRTTIHHPTLIVTPRTRFDVSHLCHPQPKRSALSPSTGNAALPLQPPSRTPHTLARCGRCATADARYTAISSALVREPLHHTRQHARTRYTPSQFRGSHVLQWTCACVRLPWVLFVAEEIEKRVVVCVQCLYFPCSRVNLYCSRSLFSSRPVRKPFYTKQLNPNNCVFSFRCVCVRVSVCILIASSAPRSGCWQV